MKLGRCSAENFGSYRHLEFDFSSSGLSLLYGRTGAGKSTLPDLAAWALFGITAKNGNADEVRSWLSDEPTSVTLQVDEIVVTRIRGTSKQNDLYWTDAEEAFVDGVNIRGKDMAETQRLLEERLGVTADLYLMGAYFSEFSPSAGFFMAKAKDRRSLLENIAPLELAVRLGERASEARKTTKKLHDALSESLAKAQGKLEQLQNSAQRASADAKRWNENQARLLATLEAKYASFEADKATQLADLKHQAIQWDITHSERTDALILKMEALAADIVDDGSLAFELSRAERQIRKHSKVHCPTCSSPIHSQELEIAKNDLERIKAERQANAVRQVRFDAGRAALEAAQETVNPRLAQISQVEASLNHFNSELNREADKVNPFVAQLTRFDAEIEASFADVLALSTGLGMLKHKIASLTTLYDLSYTLRGELLKNALKEIETGTNDLLEKHFDAEIRVSLELEGSDSLKVEIFKGGYGATYRQLSKGQRQLLKLAFGVAVMRAASNKSGVHFQNLFFDESLDGMDEDLKVKAFTLFETLSQSHDNVLLIDHAQSFQNLFSTRYLVSMDGDESTVGLENG